ncbi:MAG: hypothetical protein Q9195_009533, partial [Heterodermia aff. obscurata]
MDRGQAKPNIKSNRRQPPKPGIQGKQQCIKKQLQTCHNVKAHSKLLSRENMNAHFILAAVDPFTKSQLIDYSSRSTPQPPQPLHSNAVGIVVTVVAPNAYAYESFYHGYGDGAYYGEEK